MGLLSGGESGNNPSGTSSANKMLNGSGGGKKNSTASQNNDYGNLMDSSGQQQSFQDIQQLFGLDPVKNFYF